MLFVVHFLNDFWVARGNASRFLNRDGDPVSSLGRRWSNLHFSRFYFVIHVTFHVDFHFGHSGHRVSIPLEIFVKNFKFLSFLRIFFQGPIDHWHRLFLPHRLLFPTRSPDPPGCDSRDSFVPFFLFFVVVFFVVVENRFGTEVYRVFFVRFMSFICLFFVAVRSFDRDEAPPPLSLSASVQEPVFQGFHWSNSVPSAALSIPFFSSSIPPIKKTIP